MIDNYYDIGKNRMDSVLSTTLLNITLFSFSELYVGIPIMLTRRLFGASLKGRQILLDGPFSAESGSPKAQN